MGLVSASQVPTFFYVDNPTNVSAGATASSAPRVGVTFNGTRRDVLIEDIIAILASARPSAADSPRVHRQAFLLVVGRGRSADNAQIAKVDRIRRAWETFFLQATEGRMQALHGAAVAKLAARASDYFDQPIDRRERLALPGSISSLR